VQYLRRLFWGRRINLSGKCIPPHPHPRFATNKELRHFYVDVSLYHCYSLESYKIEKKLT
jgi:hypothetical protein